jgi:hypothetical protein
MGYSYFVRLEVRAHPMIEMVMALIFMNGNVSIFLI